MSKNKAARMLAVLVVLSAVSMTGVQAVQAAAAVKNTAATADYSRIQVQVNRQTLDLTGRTVQLDAASHMLLPLRITTEKLGYILEWDAETSSVELRKGAQRIILRNGVNAYQSDDQPPIELDAAPSIVMDNMYVPLGFFKAMLHVPAVFDEVGTVFIGEEGGQAGASALYRNKEANFKISFPTSWDGQYTVQAITGDEADKVLPHALHVVKFMYPTKIPQDLLTVSVFKSTDWASLSKVQRAQVGEVLMDQGGQLYVAALPKSNPYEKNSSQADTYAQMMLTLEQLRAIFSVITP